MMEQNTYHKITDKKQIRLLFLLCWLVYFTTYLGRLNYSASLAEMVRAGGFSKSQAGIIGTGFFFAYGAGQFVSGFLGDRLPPGRMVFTGLFASGLCNLCMAQLKEPGLMALVWCFNGLFQALIWSPLIRLFYEYYEADVRTKACISLNSSVPIGTMAAYGITALIIWLAGWRLVFSFAFVMLTAVSFLWLFGLKRIGRETGGEEDAGSLRENGPEAVKSAGSLRENGPEAGESAKRLWAASPFDWKRLLISAGLGLLICALFVQGALKDGVTTWIPTYISETYGVSPVLAITSTMIIPMFNLLGVYLASFVNSRWFQDEVRTAGVFFAICAMSLLILWASSGRGMVLAFLMLAVSTTSMMAVNTMLIAVLPAYFGAVGRASSVSGLLNSFVYAGGAVSTYGIGALSAGIGWKSTIFCWLVLAAAAMALCFCVAAKWLRYRKDVFRI